MMDIIPISPSPTITRKRKRTYTHTHILVRGFNWGYECLLKVTWHIPLFAYERYVFPCFDKSID